MTKKLQRTKSLGHPSVQVTSIPVLRDILGAGIKFEVLWLQTTWSLRASWISCNVSVNLLYEHFQIIENLRNVTYNNVSKVGNWFVRKLSHSSEAWGIRGQIHYCTQQQCFPFRN